MEKHKDKERWECEFLLIYQNIAKVIWLQLHIFDEIFINVDNPRKILLNKNKTNKKVNRF